MMQEPVKDCCRRRRANASKFVVPLAYIARPSRLCVVWLLCHVLRFFPALTNSGLSDANEKNSLPRTPCEYDSYLHQNSRQDSSEAGSQRPNAHASSALSTLHLYRK